ncbi:hypothetical protein CYLTODRAFT_243607 [Cylindrobasidium torrendii FP15055 ss-10]|uniref:Uncharacterized protein n=1 Tax=Cylindrobasidium torrendii FP15055 ss-10 TaxID=1314674 RepID=A0A0D7BG21_9AGAR|nr:hypothetical protein CYLTODRAFT_243607 [Cylindrobasidium torrendii FP15055 ss-10]
MRRMPTSRKSRWDGKLAPPRDTRRSHSYDDQRQEGAQHQPIHMPPGDITPPRWSSVTIPSTGSSPMGPPLEMPGTVFQSQATGTVGYSPGSIYAPPGQGGVLPQYLPTPSMASTMYTPSMASSAYTMSPASTSSSYLMSPPSAAYNGVPLYPSSTVTLSPPGTYPMAMGASPYAISQPALSPYTTAVPLQYHY